MHALAPKLVERGHGGIIFTGSMEGETPFPYSSAYASTKGFIHQFAGSLHMEMRTHGVDVLLLAPGSTDTNAPISQGFSRDQLPGLMSAHEVARQALDKPGKKACGSPVGTTGCLCAFCEFCRVIGPSRWPTAA